MKACQIKVVDHSLQVKVLDLDEEDGKLVVSERLAKAASAVKLVRGAVIEGVVTGLRPFGVFVELGGGLNGLIHISQLSQERVTSVESCFALGDKVRLMVMDHDQVSQRVALSTKVLESTPGEILRDKQQLKWKN